MRCWNCGTKIVAEEPFCANCGVDVMSRKAQTSQLVVCPTCSESFPVSLLDRNGYTQDCPECRSRKEAKRVSEKERKEREKEKLEASDRADYRSQRKFERFEVAKCFVRVFRRGLTAVLLRRDKKAMAPLIDLSLTGLQCETEKPYAKGEVVDLELLVPAFNTPLLLRGAVRWVDKARKDHARIGIEFDTTDEGTRKHLEALQDHQSLRDAAYLIEDKAVSSATLQAIRPEEYQRPADF